MAETSGSDSKSGSASGMGIAVEGSGRVDIVWEKQEKGEIARRRGKGESRMRYLQVDMGHVL